MKTIEYKGYVAKIEFDDEDQIFVGEIIGIDDIIAFHSENAKEIIPVFHDMVDGYLETCKKRGLTPQKSFSGKFVVRIPPDLHAKLSVLANSANKSLNTWLEELIRRSVKAA